MQVAFGKTVIVLAGLLAYCSAATNFWYANMDHVNAPRGYAPNMAPQYGYPVFYAVNPSSGPSIQTAINDDGNGGSRHGQWLSSQPRVVFLAAGVYYVSQTITMNTDTILMGDATNPPTIKAAAGFSGSILIQGQDPATGVAGENSFAVGIKNIILDTTNIAGGQAFTALAWGVAQACQLQNVKITMSSSSGGNGHTGISLGRGSTLTVADVRVERGQHGIWHNGHQQALYKNINFYQNTIGLRISGGNTISVFSPTFTQCGNAIIVDGGSPSVSIVDGSAYSTGVIFKTSVYPSFVIENFYLDGNSVSDVAQIANGNTIYGPQAGGTVPIVSYGNTYKSGNSAGQFGANYGSSNRVAALTPGGKYPVLPAPNFASFTTSSFINIKDSNQNGGYTVKGDNTVDESGVLNSVLAYAASQGKIAYFPFGIYRVDSTLFVPVGTKIVGEAWSTITGNGNYFKDSSNPKPIVKVGNSGDVGVAQIQDMRFTVSDVLPGAIIVQINAAGNAPGDVAIWNSLITVGGTRGASALTNTCTSPSAECQAAFIGLHLTASSSAYIENVWNWIADHTTEDFSGGSNIAGKGGVLVQSTKATWLHGLGSEHWWLYQLNLWNAQNVMVSLLQSETNYDQGDHTQQIPPAPWVANIGTWGDPDFSWCGGGDTRCRMGFSNYIQGGSNIFYYGSASWSFFSGPGYQACASGSYTCQNDVHWIQSAPSNINAYGFCTKDSYSSLRLPSGTKLVTSNGWTGGWPGGGGDVGRYNA